MATCELFCGSMDLNDGCKYRQGADRALHSAMWPNAGFDDAHKPFRHPSIQSVLNKDCVQCMTHQAVINDMQQQSDAVPVCEHA